MLGQQNLPVRCALHNYSLKKKHLFGEELDTIIRTVTGVEVLKEGKQSRLVHVVLAPLNGAPSLSSHALTINADVPPFLSAQGRAHKGHHTFTKALLTMKGHPHP